MVGKGWLEAKDLQVGNQVLLASGEKAAIENGTKEKLETPVKVYNFEVADWHTYFVADIGVLVHNDCTAKGNGFQWTGKNYSEMGKNLSPKEMIGNLEKSGWTKTIESGGKKSGPATILIDPKTGTKVRIHAEPGEGIPYFRVQNKGGGYLDDNGVFPSNATKQELRDTTHFYFVK